MRKLSRKYQLPELERTIVDIEMNRRRYEGKALEVYNKVGYYCYSFIFSFINFFFFFIETIFMSHCYSSYFHTIYTVSSIKEQIKVNH